MSGMEYPANCTILALCARWRLWSGVVDKAGLGAVGAVSAAEENARVRRAPADEGEGARLGIRRRGRVILPIVQPLMLREAFHSVRWVEEERARNRTVGPMSIVVVDVVEVVVFNDRIASGQQTLGIA